MNWYKKIIKNPDDFQMIMDATEWYERQFEESRKTEVNKGGLLIEASADLPGILTYRHGQLQELEAILEHLNISLRKTRSEKFRKYLEHYNKELSSRDAERYTDSDAEIVALCEIINSVSLIRNKFLSLTKGLETRGFQLNNIIKLRSNGFEDASFSPIWVSR